MKGISAWFKRHTVLACYILTFVISWGAMLVLIFTWGIPTNAQEAARILPVAIPALLLGPAVSSMVTTALADGKAGFAEIRARLLTWRVNAGWYAMALLLPPAVMLGVPLVMTRFSPMYVPGIFLLEDRASSVIFGILGGIFVGLFEELGWTGVVIPRLRLRHSVLATGLIVGVLWGAWHIMANGVLSMRTGAGALSPAAFLALRGTDFLIGHLPAFRVIMVWVYDRTRSLLLAVLMHAGLTSFSLIFMPQTMPGEALLTFDLVLAGVMWAILAIIFWTNRRAFAAQGIPAAQRPIAA